ncbi:MAG: T9SS type A sorting domain-containing protein, partial [Aequorivita sp.]|nr:T9SS type A sorting domain-containing protein [Aequorivita sp.]
GKVYFQATDGIHAEELWVTDGTEAGTYMVKDINTTTQNYGGSFPDNFTVYNNKLYFTAADGNSTHLWVTDGTEAGTVKIAPATYEEPTSVNYLFLFEDELFFMAQYQTSVGKELYKLDATTMGVADYSLEKINIYPNPVKDVLHILDNNLNTQIISIISTTGQVVQKIFNQNQVDVSSLSPGIYYAKIETNENIVVKKFIKK